MKICSYCVLPETFPGTSFDDEGVCNHCRKFDGKSSKLTEIKKKYEDKFLQLIGQIRAQNRRSYDVLMAYSGGKDSTYTMSLLQNKYNLRVLAVSFDNGFLSDTAICNIKRVTNQIDTDLVFFKPRWGLLKEIFLAAAERELYSKKTLERASTICTTCIGFVKSICLKMAIEQDIPMIGYGWSPGQAPVQSSIMKNNPSFIKMAQQAILGPLREISGNEIERYFLSERHYANPDLFPHNVHPMAWEFYNESMILNEIQKFGWTAPTDTDTNSTNCLLNAFANDAHIKRYGFHPYVWEISNMVRESVMSRDEGIHKIYQDQDKKLVDIAKVRLEID